MKKQTNSWNRAAKVSGIGAFFAMLCLAGCIAGVPLAPHPTVVTVPNPRQIDPSLELETLDEMYAVSPDVDPDGLGPMDWIWDQSFLRLTPWAIAEKREQLANVTFARTRQQQHEKMALARTVYQYGLAFEGILIGDFAEWVLPSAYMPEGIYLIDDQGEKTLPLAVESLDQATGRATYNASGFGAAFQGFPRIVFPGAALRETTRSLSLYIATRDKRARFTWVFDPAYTPPQGEAGTPGRRWRGN